MSTEVSTVTGEVVVTKGEKNAFERLASAPGIVTRFGHDLVKGDPLDDLTGMDLIITKITVRKGVDRPENCPFTSLNAGYLSLELLTNPFQRVQIINRCRVASKMEPVASLSDLEIMPGDAVVFNDGGTGIYRDIVELLEGEGYISTPSARVRAPKHFSRYDTVPEEWEIHKGRGIESEDDPFLGYETEILVHCTRGIRLSKYDGKFPGEAKTRYLS